jgi:hypothetical protein
MMYPNGGYLAMVDHGKVGMTASGRYCCKSRKSRGSENLANIEYWSSQPLQGFAEPIRASAVAFALIDVVPHIAARETHERSLEFSVISQKKDFFNTIRARRTFVLAQSSATVPAGPKYEIWRKTVDFRSQQVESYFSSLGLASA